MARRGTAAAAARGLVLLAAAGVAAAALPPATHVLADTTSLIVLGVLVLALLLFLGSRPRLRAEPAPVALSTTAPDSPELRAAFQRLRRDYLTVFLPAVFADWMMGPYMYALYEQHGYDTAAIGMLFVVGFTSAMVSGTAAGALADKYGRRRSCIVYAVTYALSCLSMNSRSWPVLLVGRVLGGLATSLLYTSFDAWLVCEHHRRQLPDRWLPDLFSTATTLSAVAAIVASLVSLWCAEHMGAVATFNAALVPLALTAVLASARWSENYGDLQAPALASLWHAARGIATDVRLICVMLISCIFEAVMFVFIFMWTPSLRTRVDVGGAAADALPYGLIFAAFMVWKVPRAAPVPHRAAPAAAVGRLSRVACAQMAGSQLFRVLLPRCDIHTMALGAFVLAAGALFVPVFAASPGPVLAAYMVFEACRGGAARRCVARR